jgi:bla regulator protein BlaR1
MTRRFLVAAAVFFALFAGKPAAHCEKGHAVVYADDGVTFANGISRGDLSVLQKAYGRHFAYFERDGQRYVITDPETLDRISAVYSPQWHLGRKQAELGAKEAALGAQQAQLGLEQARIGMRQVHDQSASLEHRQNELGKEQDKLGEKQDALGRQQEAIGQQQEELSRQTEKQVAVIFDQAIRTGVAKKR